MSNFAKEVELYFPEYSTLNNKLAETKKLSVATLKEIKHLHSVADSIIENPSQCENPLKELEGIEYKLQELWGFPLDKNYHHYSFKLKDCTCPLSDNMSLLGSGMFRKSTDCKYHGIN